MSLHRYHEILKGTKWNPLHPWKCCGSKTYMSIWKKWPQISVDLLRKAQHGKNITCLMAQYTWATWCYHSLACWATEGSWGNKKLQIEALFYISRSNLLILVSTFTDQLNVQLKTWEILVGLMKMIVRVIHVHPMYNFTAWKKTSWNKMVSYLFVLDDLYYMYKRHYLFHTLIAIRFRS